MSSAGSPLRIRGSVWLDVATGDSLPCDLLVAGGVIQADDGRQAVTVDASGLTAMFGLWDCHAHPGGLMYDNAGVGFFEGSPDRTIRAGENFAGAVAAGVTGVRAMDEADDLDLAWGRAYAAGTTLGPRVTGAGRAVRTTAGHGTCFPRHYTGVEAELVCDGPDAMAWAVRRQVERGAQWIKVMLTGGLYSPHETAEGGQFTEAELDTVMEVANLRGIPVAAHCGGGSAVAGREPHGLPARAAPPAARGCARPSGRRRDGPRHQLEDCQLALRTTWRVIPAESLPRTGSGAGIYCPVARPARWMDYSARSTD